MKILINVCYGGFSLSKEAIKRYAQIKKVKYESVDKYNIKRNDPILIQVFEELGTKTGDNSKLRLVEIPDDVKWVIMDYDGSEHVAEKHRKWYADD